MSRIDAQDFQSRPDLFNEAATRSLLDQLLTESRLYRRSKDYQDLLEFVVRLRDFAPFNAMLLQVQKPGLRYAAAERDWLERFGRRPKEGARPLLLLWPFGPVALVYDVADTDGPNLPEDIFSFPAMGSVSPGRLRALEKPLFRNNIALSWFDAGDSSAGYVRILRRAANDNDATQYGIWINRYHDPAVQFTTLAHELAHLCLGHLGRDRKQNVPRKPRLSHTRQEIAAESVAYIVCYQNGVKPKSQTYLSDFVHSETSLDVVDV